MFAITPEHDYFYFFLLKTIGLKDRVYVPVLYVYMFYMFFCSENIFPKIREV